MSPIPIVAVDVRPDRYPIPAGYLSVVSIDHYAAGDWVVARWRGGQLVAGWAVYDVARLDPREEETR